MKIGVGVLVVLVGCGSSASTQLGEQGGDDASGGGHVVEGGGGDVVVEGVHADAGLVDVMLDVAPEAAVVDAGNGGDAAPAVDAPSSNDGAVASCSPALQQDFNTLIACLVTNCNTSFPGDSNGSYAAGEAGICLQANCPAQALDLQSADAGGSSCLVCLDYALSTGQSFSTARTSCF